MNDILVGKGAAIGTAWSLMTLAEGFSRAGVPVVMAGVKRQVTWPRRFRSSGSGQRWCRLFWIAVCRCPWSARSSRRR
jgi:hypothetical protein